MIISDESYVPREVTQILPTGQCAGTDLQSASRLSLLAVSPPIIRDLRVTGERRRLVQTPVASKEQHQNKQYDHTYAADGVKAPTPAVVPNGKTPHSRYDHSYREHEHEHH